MSVSQSAIAEAVKPANSVSAPGAGLPVAIVAGLLAVCLGSAVLLLQWDNIVHLFGQACGDYLGDLLSAKRCESGVNKIRIYALAFALLPIIMLVERWRPADPDQPRFSPGLLVDLVWFVSFPIIIITLRSPIEDFLKSTFGPTLSAFNPAFIKELPMAAQLTIVILFSDFMAWLTHWLRHKVPFIWEFHKIHHSQTQLNYFSTVRLHPGDMIANSLIRFLPFTLLGLNEGLPAFLVWSTFLRIYEMFVHSNIKTNLGPLRYIIVTPQSHRIHHSERPEHYDMNMGNFFSIWDFMFRTQCLDFNVYPKTHSGDPECPTGTANTLGGAFVVLFREMIYPFKALARKARKAKTS